MSNQKEKALPPKKPTITTAATTKQLDGGIQLPTATDNYFEIVLIDMIATVRSDKMITVKRNMYDTDYACISYRWGEVNEQVLMTPDYNAHITSFDLDDLLVMCQQILNWSSDGGNLEEEEEEEEGEEEGEEEDAVGEEEEGAVDEEDQEEEGAEDEEDQEEDAEDEEDFGVHVYSEYTIPYLWVDAISVDQMDSVHKKNTIHRMTDIYHNAQVIVAVPDLHRSYLERDPTHLPQFDTISKYGVKVFRHIANRCWRTEEEEEAELQEEEDEEVEEGEEEEEVEEGEEQQDEQDDATVIEDDDDSTKTKEHKHRGFRQFIKEAIYAKPVDEAVDGLCVKEPEETEQQVDEEDQADDEQVNEEYVCTCTDDLDEKETEAFLAAVDFVHYLVDDWSSRVWVISEYSIGRHSNMKLWFLSICYDNYANRPRELIKMFDPNEPTIYDELLQERSFLHMMLNSKATRNEDRFYAVLPLYAKYKHLAADHAISTWGITDAISVRLQLYRMVSFEEKLTMLLCGVRPSYKSDVILPSFAAFYMPQIFDWALELSTSKPILMKSIDLHEDNGLHYLAIAVPWSRTFTDAAVEHDLDVASHALGRLGLTDLVHELATVFIPVTIDNHTLGIKLFGHRKRNQWVMLHRMMDLVDVPPTTPTTPTPVLPKHLHHPHRSASLDTLWTDKLEMEQIFHVY